MSNWFVDKLGPGPTPGDKAISPGDQLRQAGRPPAAESAPAASGSAPRPAAQAAAAPAPRVSAPPTPPPEPEKKKKKGWF